MLIFGGIGVAIVGAGMFQFFKDAWSASSNTPRQRQPWDLP